MNILSALSVYYIICVCSSTERAVGIHNVGGSTLYLILFCIIILLSILNVRHMTLYAMLIIPTACVLLYGINWSSLIFAATQWWTFIDPAENLLAILVILTGGIRHLHWNNSSYVYNLTVQPTIMSYIFLQYRFIRPKSIIHAATSWQTNWLCMPLIFSNVPQRLGLSNINIQNTNLQYTSRNNAIIFFNSMLLAMWTLLLIVNVYGVSLSIWSHMSVIAVSLHINTRPKTIWLMSLTCVSPAPLTTFIIFLLFLNINMIRLHLMFVIIPVFLLENNTVKLIITVSENLWLIIMNISIWRLLKKRYLSVRRLWTDTFLPA